MAEKESNKPEKNGNKQIVPNKYVFTGYFRKNELISLLEPVPNLILYSDDTTKEKKAAGGLIAWKTDKNGGLLTINKFGEGKGISVGLKHQKFIIPPLEMVSYAVATAKYGTGIEDWTKKLGEILKKQGLEPSEFANRNVKFKDLRKPATDPDEDKIYREWYNLRKKEKKSIYSVVIPKTRAVFFIFSSDLFKTSELTIYINGKKLSPGDYGHNEKFEVKYDSDTDTTGIALNGDYETLPVGQYRIDVALSETASTGTWGKNSKKDEKTAAYSLIEYVRFPIKNHFCQMEIISCDPVSIEEALVTQYPLQYTHLLKEKKKIEEDVVKNGSIKKTEGFNNVTQLLCDTKEKSNLVNGVAFADTGTKKIFALGKAFKGLISEDEKELIKSMDMVFTSLETWEKTLDLKSASLDFADALAGSKARPDTVFEALKKSYWTNFFVSEEATVEHFNDTWAKKLSQKYFKFDLPEKTENILRPLNMIMKPVEIVKGLIAVKGSYHCLDAAGDTLKKSLNNYQLMIKDYYDKTYFINDENKTGSDIEAYFTPVGSVQQIKYDSDKYEVVKNVKNNTIIDDAAKYIFNDWQNLSKLIMVKSYTDSTASNEHNIELSFSRAKGVKEAIIQKIESLKKEENEKNKKDKKKINNVNIKLLSNRIITIGYGEKYAGNDKDNPKAKAQNRRSDVFSGEGIIDHAGCREGIRNLEKQRSLTVAKKQNLSTAEQKMCFAALDAVLGIASIIPVTAAVGVLGVALKEGVVALMASYKSVYSAMDNMMFDGLLMREKELKKKQSEIRKKSDAQYNLMTQEKSSGNTDYTMIKEYTDSVDLIDTDFRIRSEVISGLFYILFMAQLNVYQENKRDGKVLTIEQSREAVINKLKEYKTDAYIQNFILNDNWSYPVRPGRYYSIAEYWIQAVKLSKGWGKHEQFHIDSNYLFLEYEPPPKEYLVNNATYKLDSKARSKAFYIDSHQITKFQKHFPIHTLYSKDINDLAEIFSPNQAGVYDEKIYEYMNIHCRKRDETKMEDWKPLSDKKDPLSPYDQIRIIIVLKKDIQESSTVDIHVRRNSTNADGIKYQTVMLPLTENILLEDEKAYATDGHYGCVFQPFYQLHKQTVYGLKPITGWLGYKSMENPIVSELKDLKDLPLYLRGLGEMFYWLRTMDYYLTVKVAESPRSHHVIYYSKNKKEFDVLAKDADEDKAEIIVDLDVNRPHMISVDNLTSDEIVYFDQKVVDYKDSNDAKEYEKSDDGKFYIIKDEAALLERDFLASYTTEDQYHRLMDNAWDLPITSTIYPSVLIKVGDGKFVNPHKAFKSDIGKSVKDEWVGNTLAFSDFDWNSKVEFIVVASFEEFKDKAIDEYKKKEMDWMNIPAKMTLFLDKMLLKSNIEGPSFDSKSQLQYIGKAEIVQDGTIVKTFSVKLDNKVEENKKRKKNTAIEEIVEWFESEDQSINDKAMSLLSWDEPTAFLLPKPRHIYVAHFEMEYTSHCGELVKGLKPFGEKLIKENIVDDSYEYFIKVSSKDKSGLLNETCRTGNEGVDAANALTFKFSAPEKSYFESGSAAPWNRKCSHSSDVKDHKKITLDQWIKEYPQQTDFRPRGKQVSIADID